jgi:superfamily II DNA or RNA helicase
MDYQEFLKAKHEHRSASGFAPGELHPRHFPFQRDIVAWAVQQGRAAVFADTGLGKTGMQVEWARHVQRHTNGAVLIAAPLAVAHQTIAEGAQLDCRITYVKSQAEVTGAGLFITNYDRITAFDGAAFGGIVLDESSILKSYSGKTKQALISQFSTTPYRLACTATPAPNDYMELGNHAEFLGIMPSHEMLMRWFINDTMKAGGYRLKGHAESAFWQWVASWAACVSHPRDLGYDESGYDLPPLDIRQHTVAADIDRLIRQTGQFVSEGKQSATGLWRDKAETAPARCAASLDIVRSDPAESWLIWVSTDAEADTMRAALDPALTVEVRGSQSAEEKERRLTAWLRGEKRYLITKPKIAGFGINAQHCARQVFVGITYSFEYLYQALRRSYRFGQTRPVIAHLVVAETESNVLAVVNAKQAMHREMQAKMTQAMRETGLLAQRGEGLRLYHAPHRMIVPSWISSRKAS